MSCSMTQRSYTGEARAAVLPYYPTWTITYLNGIAKGTFLQGNTNLLTYRKFGHFREGFIFTKLKPSRNDGINPSFTCRQ